MYRKPEGGEERMCLCETTAYSCFPAIRRRSWDFREGHIRFFSCKATERHGRGACSDKGSKKSKLKSVPFFFLMQQPEDNRRRYWESAPHQGGHGSWYSL